MSPLLSGISELCVVPLADLCTVLGQYMSKKLIEQAGGKNAISFGMGKSNAKSICAVHSRAFISAM